MLLPRRGPHEHDEKGEKDRANPAKPTPFRHPWMEPGLAPAERAKRLVARMTLDEKIAQVMNGAPAIPRLGVAPHNYEFEGLHGVGRAGLATVFPQRIGLGATFDADLLLRVATAIADEARAKHHELAKQGVFDIYTGLTYWCPNVNIFRDPRWGRGHETFGECPHLISRLGVAYVRGMQGDDSRWLKTVATPKHFAVHISNFFGWQVAKAAGVTACRGYGTLAAGQFLYNLIHREPEREIIPALADSRMGLFCYSPLGAGLLTGKYRGMRDPAEGSRLAARMKVDGTRFWHPRGFAAAECVARVAAESGIPMSRLAIGWPLGRSFVTSVIIGVKDAAQLADNIAIGDWDVPSEVWSALEKATRPEEEYLTWFNRANYARSFGAAEHHDASRELP